LAVTRGFLRAYLERPEIRPVESSCAAETDLYARMVGDPYTTVSASDLTAFEDPDAAENYGVFLRFRDWLTGFPSLEAAYLDLVRGTAPGIPPLFVDHIVQVILRGILSGCDDPLRMRAAELLFRAQMVNIVDGAIMLADEETVELRAAATHQTNESGPRAKPESTLLADDTDGPEAPPGVALDVLGPDNIQTYRERSDRFDTVFDLTIQSFGQDALARVLEAWVNHFLGARVSIQPVASIRDERWRWHVGLDADSTAILNDLYEGRAVDEDRLGRLLALFRLEFKDPTAVLPDMADRPVYLGMAMTPDKRLRLKPQNLLVNLPTAVTA
jgi:hypothetical protein